MSTDLSSLFLSLSDLLLQHQAYWRPMAFRERHLPWMDQHPGLVQRLLALSPEQIENLGTDNVALTHFMSPDLPVAVTLAQLCAVPVLPQRDIAPPDPRFYAGIPGRKWEQVDRFVRALPVADLPVLEWCAENPSGVLAAAVPAATGNGAGMGCGPGAAGKRPRSP
ncbi:MAG: hypothetical protein R3F47_14315 [Gammaproteobacteria bacterium]